MRLITFVSLLALGLTGCAIAGLSGSLYQPSSVPPTPPTSPVAGAPATPVPEPTLATVVAPFLHPPDGQISLVVHHLQTGEQVTWQAEEPRPAASLYKLALLVAVYWEERQGHLTLAEALPDGRSVAEGLFDMITWSDNEAALALLRRLGRARVNAFLAAQGLRQTVIAEEAWTSAADVARLLVAMARGQAVDAEASAAMLALLRQQQIRDRLPRYLPPTVPVAHKTGDLPGVRHDAGLVEGPAGPYIIVVMLTDLADEEAGVEWIARLSQAVYGYFARLTPRA